MRCWLPSPKPDCSRPSRCSPPSVGAEENETTLLAEGPGCREGPPATQHVQGQGRAALLRPQAGQASLPRSPPQGPPRVVCLALTPPLSLREGLAAHQGGLAENSIGHPGRTKCFPCHEAHAQQRVQLHLQQPAKGALRGWDAWIREGKPPSPGHCTSKRLRHCPSQTLLSPAPNARRHRRCFGWCGVSAGAGIWDARQESFSLGTP